MRNKTPLRDIFFDLWPFWFCRMFRNCFVKATIFGTCSFGILLCFDFLYKILSAKFFFIQEEFN